MFLIKSIILFVCCNFDEHDDCKKIKNAYLYNEYKMGNNVKPDIKQTNKNIEWIHTPKEQILKKHKL